MKANAKDRLCRSVLPGQQETARQIAERLRVSPNYVRTILRSLRRAEVVRRVGRTRAGYVWEGTQEVLPL